MATKHPYGHDFNDSQDSVGQGVDAGRTQNLLHAIRGGVMGGNEYRVQNMPRCKVNLLGQIPMVAPYNAEVPWAGTLAQSLVYDTDSMLVASPNITIKTPGLYMCCGSVLFSGGGILPLGTTCQLIYNNSAATTNIIAVQGVHGDPSTWGTWVSMSMPWPMNAGDRLSMYVQVEANTNFTVPWMAAYMVSTL